MHSSKLQQAAKSRLSLSLARPGQARLHQSGSKLTHTWLQVWKCGTCLRVDGSLVGLNSKSTGMMPDWKHGHFSLLFDGASTPATLFFVDHVKQRYYDLTKERKASQPSIDAEVRSLSLLQPVSSACSLDAARQCFVRHLMQCY